MNIYLDIDGVILTNNKHPANFARDFIKYITDHHTVYWLTTHCKGDAEYTIAFLGRYFDQDTVNLLKKIKPTNWITSKTEAIDFNAPFLWFDDYIFNFEMRDLIKHKALENWIKIDLSVNDDKLLDVIIHFPL